MIYTIILLLSIVYTASAFSSSHVGFNSHAKWMQKPEKINFRNELTKRELLPAAFAAACAGTKNDMINSYIHTAHLYFQLILYYNEL